MFAHVQKLAALRAERADLRGTKTQHLFVDDSAFVYRLGTSVFALNNSLAAMTAQVEGTVCAGRVQISGEEGQLTTIIIPARSGCIFERDVAAKQNFVSRKSSATNHRSFRTRHPAGHTQHARHINFGSPMKRIWTIIGVRDVPSSFKWYQSLLGQPQTAPGHNYFGQILDTDGSMLLCLHEWGEHDHPTLTSPDSGAPGNGLLLFFRVDDYELCLARARALVAQFAEEPHLNANTQTPEFSLRDPDGYFVTISALSV
ncbi:MAG: VOC family protein [Gemmatimonadaceae bacterium]